MSELQVRLSEMREAAEKLRRGDDRLSQSTQAILDCLNYLRGQGVDSYNLYLALQLYPSDLKFKHFAETLDHTADDIEAMYTQMQTASDFDRRKVWFPGAALLIAGMTTSSEPEEEPTPYDLEDFIATHNRPVYDQLQELRQTLEQKQQDLNKLMDSQNQLQNDLDSLKDRLRSFDPKVNLENTPRVQTLEIQMTNTTNQIEMTKAEIVTLQKDIENMALRLDRVKPAPGADLSLISKLQNSTTDQFVKANTFDCVNYVVNRVTIPDTLAHHAYLWDDAALKHPEFGITVSDKPLVGSILVMEREHSYADDAAGHLMIVERVENGNIWVTDNNHHKPVLLSDLTTELSGENLKYLYLPWHTRA